MESQASQVALTRYILPVQTKITTTLSFSGNELAFRQECIRWTAMSRIDLPRNILA